MCVRNKEFDEKSSRIFRVTVTFVDDEYIIKLTVKSCSLALMFRVVTGEALPLALQVNCIMSDNPDNPERLLDCLYIESTYRSLMFKQPSTLIWFFSISKSVRTDFCSRQEKGSHVRH